MTRVLLGLWFASAILAAGCGGGTIIADYAVKAEVLIREVNGGTEEAGVVVKVPRHPDLLSPFDAVQYRGEDFEWIFGTGTFGVGGSIANLSRSSLCMRFDQAQVRSNFHPEPIALMTYSWVVFGEKTSVLGSTDPGQRQYFGPPSVCLEPGQRSRISFAPDLRPLFPTQKLFNVQWPDKVPELSDKGIGNWIALSVPVEIGERRQVMDVKLTATDSKARISHY